MRSNKDKFHEIRERDRNIEDYEREIRDFEEEWHYYSERPAFGEDTTSRGGLSRPTVSDETKGVSEDKERV